MGKSYGKVGSIQDQWKEEVSSMKITVGLIALIVFTVFADDSNAFSLREMELQDYANYLEQPLVCSAIGQTNKDVAKLAKEINSDLQMRAKKVKENTSPIEYQYVMRVVKGKAHTRLRYFYEDDLGKCKAMYTETFI